MARFDKARRATGRALGRYQLRAIARGATRIRPSEERTVSLGIGPYNTAGQAFSWARALENQETGVKAESFGPILDSVLQFPVDRTFTSGLWNTRPWQVEHARYVLSTYTHLLLESGRSVFGRLRNGFFDGDLPVLRSVGIRVGLVLHGSDIRNPDHHASTEKFSPFRLTPQDERTDPEWAGWVAMLREKTVDLKRRLDSHAATIPKFVSTPGLLDYVPDAEWLPVVVDTTRQPRPTGPSGRPPIVVHLPTNERMKGSPHIDAVCERLETAGVLRYVRPGLMSPASALEMIERAFCVVDSVSYGDGPTVTACQAMAAGVPVVGHISDSVRKRIPGALPIVEARPDNLEHVIRRLVSNPDEVASVQAAGRAYVERFHSGRFSAGLLASFLEGN